MSGPVVLRPFWLFRVRTAMASVFIVMFGCRQPNCVDKCDCKSTTTKRLHVARDILEKLREEWYSESDHTPESIEEEIDDELLELEILLRSRGTIVSGAK